jgi:hypothetical protein
MLGDFVVVNFFGEFENFPGDLVGAVTYGVARV